MKFWNVVRGFRRLAGREATTRNWAVARSFRAIVGVVLEICRLVAVFATKRVLSKMFKNKQANRTMDDNFLFQKQIYEFKLSNLICKHSSLCYTVSLLIFKHILMSEWIPLYLYIKIHALGTSKISRYIKNFWRINRKSAVLLKRNRHGYNAWYKVRIIYLLKI